ncbi:MAG: VCBS repeat-containing protein [Xanthomonadales bacterium]|nr:VCBS repeat-containing protein [Xanthomonadales bacterium]
MSKRINEFPMAALLLALSLASPTFAQTGDAEQQEKLAEVLQRVEEYCGSVCHKAPPPTVMPKAFWPRAVQVMADMAAERFGPGFIPEETIRDITAFYFGSSPEALPRLPYTGEPPDPSAFAASSLGERSPAPLVVNLHAVTPESENEAELLVCDGGRNQVISLTRSGGRWTEKVLADVELPARTEVIDFDGDGDRDIVVAALGHVTPSRKLAGKVILLRQSSTGGYVAEVLLEGMGRITDARPADFDSDGDMDVAVAVFGDGGKGEVSWLENLGNGQFTKHVLVDASGALNVSLTDLDGDGSTDIISLISQEYEMVMALLNSGTGSFQRVPLASAPHPMFGFTGMNLVDLDRDGDIDFLLSNGDAHDLHTEPKPYHGVQWMENKGNLEFQFHDIGRFYGAATAVAGDLDSDGDLDVVASSWDNFWEDDKRQSMVWYENDGAQNFSRRNIMSRPRSIVTVQLLDVAGNDRLDIIAGGFRMDLAGKQFAGADDDQQSGEEAPEHELADARVILLENRLAH